MDACRRGRTESTGANQARPPPDRGRQATRERAARTPLKYRPRQHQPPSHPTPRPRCHSPSPPLRPRPRPRSPLPRSPRRAQRCPPPLVPRPRPHSSHQSHSLLQPHRPALPRSRHTRPHPQSPSRTALSSPPASPPRPSLPSSPTLSATPTTSAMSSPAQSVVQRKQNASLLPSPTLLPHPRSRVPQTLLHPPAPPTASHRPSRNPLSRPSSMQRRASNARRSPATMPRRVFASFKMLGQNLTITSIQLKCALPMLACRFLGLSPTAEASWSSSPFTPQARPQHFHLHNLNTTPCRRSNHCHRVRPRITARPFLRSRPPRSRMPTVA